MIFTILSQACSSYHVANKELRALPDLDPYPQFVSAYLLYEICS